MHIKIRYILQQEDTRAQFHIVYRKQAEEAQSGVEAPAAAQCRAQRLLMWLHRVQCGDGRDPFTRRRKQWS